MAERLFLVDGAGFAYRAYYAIKGLTNSKGQPTNAVFGFARILMKVLREYAPSHIVVVFDAPGETFRHQLYPEYKATRKATPEDLISQLPLMEEVVRAFNISSLRIPGVEADDVIGTLARRAEQAGMDVVIVTGDKDFLQLITERIRALDPSKGNSAAWCGPQEVRERFGAPPEHVVDVLALMGDSTDNIPGVRGIGEKTARTLIEQYGTLENLYSRLDQLKGKLLERLQADRDKAFLSRDLATIRTDVELDIALEACRRKDMDRSRAAALFSELEFHSLLEELLPAPDAAEETDYRLVPTLEELDRVIEEMRAAGAFAIDTETTSTDPMRAALVGISLSCAPGKAYYIPVGHVREAMLPEADLAHDPAVRPVENLPVKSVIERLRPLLEDPRIGKVGHNIKYDLIVLARAGAVTAGITLDTMVASYLTDPSLLRHNLDAICLHYLKRKTIPITDLIGKGPKAITFDKVPIERAFVYACEDADMTWRLAQRFGPLLQERGLMPLFQDVELPLIGVLARMEQAGVAIDSAVFGALQHEVEAKLAVLEARVFEAAGEPFQINSPKQLQEILFGKLRLKPLRKTKTGYSTDVDVLEELADRHPLPGLILEYRTLEKLRSTYIEALPKLIHPETGRIHTSFNQAVAATGRLSSSEPNLQNIPVRTDIGRRMRRGFIAGDKGKKLISADYSQIELRVLAHLSGDARLKEAFYKDADIHRETAARLLGVMPELVTPEMRRQAKAVNFGIVYGISPFGLAKSAGISKQDAARFIEQYFAEYPGVRAWIDDLLERARNDGFVTTLLHRRRYVPELRSSDNATRHAAERAAINTPVQGSAADIIKVAMVRLDPLLREAGGQLLLQVHDELLIEGPAEQADRIAMLTKNVMEQAVTLDVPLKVDVGVGDNWAEIH